MKIRQTADIVLITDAYISESTRVFREKGLDYVCVRDLMDAYLLREDLNGRLNLVLEKNKNDTES